MEQNILGRKPTLTVLCGLAVIQIIMRFAIPISIINGDVSCQDMGISSDVELLINSMFILIGVVGIPATYGLWMMRDWGAKTTIALSVVTIVFDVMAGLMIQASAFMGVILPFMLVAYIILNKDDFKGSVE